MGKTVSNPAQGKHLFCVCVPPPAPVSHHRGGQRNETTRGFYPDREAQVQPSGSNLRMYPGVRSFREMDDLKPLQNHSQKQGSQERSRFQEMTPSVVLRVVSNNCTVWSFVISRKMY